MKAFGWASTCTAAFLILGGAAPCQADEVIHGLWAGSLGQSALALEFQPDSSGPTQATLYLLDQDAVSFTAGTVTVEEHGLTATFVDLAATVRSRPGETADQLIIDWEQPRFQNTMTLQRSDALPLVEERKRVIGLGVNPRAPLATAQFAFLVGEWHGTKQRRGPTDGYIDTGTIVWKGRWVLDGMAIQNSSQSRSPLGGVTQWGLDTRVVNAQTGLWEHRYLNARLGAFNNPMLWHMDDEGILVSGVSQWMEPNGKMADHIIRIELIDEDHFRWTADLSMDGGETWIQENQINDNVRVEPSSVTNEG